MTGNIETGQKEGKILGCHKASEGSKGHKGHVLCLAITSDGKFLVRRNKNNFFVCKLFHVVGDDCGDSCSYIVEVIRNFITYHLSLLKRLICKKKIQTHLYLLLFINNVLNKRNHNGCHEKR